ncbi:MAG TPA: hypothetical protein PKD85_00435 [Saprospiraceae bacterium]|nr:hypothetical protein [Saprospiraceae bacterium]
MENSDLEKLNEASIIMKNSTFNIPEDILIINTKDIKGNIVIESSPDVQFLNVYKLSKKKTLLFKAEQKKRRSILLIGCKGCDITITVPLFKLIFLSCQNINLKLDSISIYWIEFVKCQNIIVEIKNILSYINIELCKNVKLFQRIKSLVYSSTSSSDIFASVFPKKEKQTHNISLSETNKRLLTYLTKYKIIHLHTEIDFTEQPYFY